MKNFFKKTFFPILFAVLFVVTGTKAASVLYQQSGGTGTGTIFTAGSIPYSQGTGLSAAYNQDNANFFYDGTNHRLGLQTSAPTHSLTLGSTATGIVLYNTSDQITNYERLVSSWISNQFNIVTNSNGTGISRSIVIGTQGTSGLTGANRYIKINSPSTISNNAFINIAAGSSTVNVGILEMGASNMSTSSGINFGLNVNPQISQSGTAGYTALLINPTHTSTGTGLKLLTDWQVGASSLVSINSTGQQIWHSTASSQGIAMYNTSDEITNYERSILKWSSNVVQLQFERGGTGTSRTLRIAQQGSGASFVQTDYHYSGSDAITNTVNTFSGSSAFGFTSGSINGSSGNTALVNIYPVINQTSTAGYTALLINPTETTTGSGVKRLISAQVGGTDKFVVDNTGAITTASLTNGLVQSTAGLLSNATAGTDYQVPITLTTTGTSGAATFIGGVLNIPQYTGGGGGSGTVTSVATDATLTGGPITTTGTLGINLSNANTWGALQTFPDNTFKLINAADNTKTGVFSLASVTTGTNVTYTMPQGALTAVTLASISNLTQTFVGATTFSGVFTASSTTVNLGTSGSSSSINVGTGATTSGNTKTINIGTAGASGSITNTTIGSATGGALGTFTLNSPTIVFAPLTTNGFVTTSGGTGTIGVTVPATGILTWLGTPSSANLISAVTDETGSGALVFGTAPTITLANGTGLPVSTGISGLGTGIATWLATPSLTNLNSAITGDIVVGAAATQTLTNKRITSRIVSTASSSTPTPNGDTTDQYEVTALAAGATFGAPTGTPTDGQPLTIRIKDNGGAQTLAWNAIYRASSDLALPTTTVISKTMYLKFIYNSADSKWDFVAYLNNF